MLLALEKLTLSGDFSSGLTSLGDFCAVMFEHFRKGGERSAFAQPAKKKANLLSGLDGNLARRPIFYLRFHWNSLQPAFGFFRRLLQDSPRNNHHNFQSRSPEICVLSVWGFFVAATAGKEGVTCHHELLLRGAVMLYSCARTVGR